MGINSLAGHFFEITDVGFFKKEGPNLRCCSCSCPQCWVSGRGVTTSTSSCSSSWTTTRSWRSLVQIGSTCRTGTPSSGPCDARDALGAHGSRRELSRAHSRHTASLFPSSRVVLMSATIASVQADSAVPGVLLPRSCPYLC